MIFQFFQGPTIFGTADMEPAAFMCIQCIKLVNDFAKRNPDYFTVLARINGSVVKNLFSQLKYADSGELSSVNYTW